MGRMQAVADELEVHGGLVAGPEGLLLGIYAEDVVPFSPIHHRLEMRVFFGSAVEQGREGDLTTMEGVHRPIEILWSYLKQGNAMLRACGFKNMHKVRIIFPIPGEAGVKVRHRKGL